MDVYGLIFIYELLNYYSLMLGIKFDSFSVEMKTDKGTKFNVIKWGEVEKYIDDLLDGYNRQYRTLVKEYIQSKKGVVTEAAEKAIVAYCNPFQRERGFFNLWLGEAGTAAERSVVQPLPFVVVNHIIRINGCTAKMRSSVDTYEYSVTAYSDRVSGLSDAHEAEKTEYKYIVSRIVNEKTCTLTYNQLAKNECPQELNAIFKKANKMLDRLRKTMYHEAVDGITVLDYMKELAKYIRRDSPYLQEWHQVYEPFNMSNRQGVIKIDPAEDGDQIISIIY